MDETIGLAQLGETIDDMWIVDEYRFIIIIEEGERWE